MAGRWLLIAVSWCCVLQIIAFGFVPETGRGGGGGEAKTANAAAVLQWQAVRCCGPHSKSMP